MRSAGENKKHILTKSLSACTGYFYETVEVFITQGQIILTLYVAGQAIIYR